MPAFARSLLGDWILLAVNERRRLFTSKHVAQGKVMTSCKLFLPPSLLLGPDSHGEHLCLAPHQCDRPPLVSIIRGLAIVAQRRTLPGSTILNSCTFNETS